MSETVQPRAADGLPHLGCTSGALRPAGWGGSLRTWRANPQAYVPPPKATQGGWYRRRGGQILEDLLKWTLGHNKVVCRAAWERAYGAATRRYRTIYGLVQRGHAPHQDEASQQAKSLLQLMDRVTDAAGVCLNQKRSWAACWWKGTLLLMDWSPNEQRIRIRGPGFKFLHANTYGPRARAVGLHLSYKVWKGCMKQGVHDVCLQLPGSNPGRVSVSRFADHSNFPECTSCLTKRNRWLSAAKSPASDPATVQVGQCLQPRSWHVSPACTCVLVMVRSC